MKKILVMQLGGIGDLVLSVPALKALRNKFPDAYIGLLVISRSAELISGIAYIDELFIWDSDYTNLFSLVKKGVFWKTWDLVKELRNKKFDLAINLENIASWRGSFKMAFLLHLISAKYKVGRDTEGRGFFFNLKVKEKSHEQKHEVETNLRVVRALGADLKDASLELPLFEENKKYVSDFVIRSGISENDLIIGINPGAFKPVCRWLEERWAMLSDKLIDAYGGKLVIIGQNKDKAVIEKITSLMKNKPLLAIDFKLKALAVLIQKFNIFITVDTGPMHIAAAVNTPLVALFGPTDVNKFSPYCKAGRCELVIKSPECKCAPCYLFNCNKKHQCMEMITVDEVLCSVRKVLGK